MRNLILVTIVVLLLISVVGCAQQTPNGSFVKIEPGALSCTDSDGGKIKEVKGTVTGVDINGESFSKSDECVRGMFLIEYYCDGNALANYNYECKCEEGACQE